MDVFDVYSIIETISLSMCMSNVDRGRSRALIDILMHADFEPFILPIQTVVEVNLHIRID